FVVVGLCGWVGWVLGGFGVWWVGLWFGGGVFGCGCCFGLVVFFGLVFLLCWFLLVVGLGLFWFVFWWVCLRWLGGCWCCGWFCGFVGFGVICGFDWRVVGCGCVVVCVGGGVFLVVLVGLMVVWGCLLGGCVCCLLFVGRCWMFLGWWCWCACWGVCLGMFWLRLSSRRWIAYCPKRCLRTVVFIDWDWVGCLSP
ncbi:hypothetical protein RA272_27665, partial [Pseudomonas syringae pv. tagetis]|uniref:hypothetical protein n=1 Tax=Pseudomonas syringae group genomosp. 7 TaxID=251699 RepID=UPI00376F6D10